MRRKSRNSSETRIIKIDTYFQVGCKYGKQNKSFRCSKRFKVGIKEMSKYINKKKDRIRSDSGNKMQ